MSYPQEHYANGHSFAALDWTGGGTGPRVLLITHKRETEPGNVGRSLRALGYGLDVRCPRLGDALPETLEAHAGAVIFGGPMSANDGDDYIRREIEWIGVPLKESKPFLGICLGGQMLARHLGAAVAPHPEGLIEVGYHPIHPSDEGRALMDWPSHVYQWHGEGFELPAGAEALAHGERFRNQAFRYSGTAFGVQFHPEMTLALIHRWTTRAHHRLSEPGAQPRTAQLAAHIGHGPDQRRWIDAFLRMWLEQG